MPVSILGTRGCGKSTVIGLLYQGMERYTTLNPDDFIYYITSETGETVLTIRNNMLKGMFPPATTRHTLDQFQFLMGFKPKMHEKLINLVKFREGAWAGLTFTVYDISGEDIQEYKRSKTADQRIKKIFDANIVVIIIDCSIFTNSTSGRKFNKMLELDKEIAIILSAYVEYRNKNKLEEELHPIFILAKADAIDNEIKNEFGLEKLSKDYDEDINYEIGNNLLKSYLSATLAAILGSQKVYVPLHKAKYFFSWVEMDKIDGMVSQAGDAKKLKVVRDKEGGHAWNAYPTHMYEGFLNNFRDLSEKYADPKKQVEEIFGRISD